MNKPTFTWEELIRDFRYQESLKGLERLSNPGKLAGTLDSRGFRRVRYQGRNYSMRRLVWMYFKGASPNFKMASYNGDIDDCRIENIGPSTWTPQNPLGNESFALKMTSLPDPEHVRDYLRYEPMPQAPSGTPGPGLYWAKAPRYNMVVGTRAGTPMPSGDRRIRLFGHDFYEKEALIAVVTGRWPEAPVLFRDGDRNNVRPENLQEMTRW